MTNVKRRTKMTKEQVEALANAVRSMRGERSAKDYATDAGVSQSMISKYENQQITSACSLETLIKLHKAQDPGCDISLEELKAIVGIELSSSVIPNDDLYGFSFVTDKICKEFAGAVVERPVAHFFGCEHDKDITVTLPGNNMWYISNDVSMYAREKGRDFLDNYLFAFAKCIMAADSDTENARYSFLINSQEHYEQFAKLLGKMRLKSCASVILVRYNIYDGITKIEESTCLDEEGKSFERYL